MSKGIVYIITNPSMPGWVKIGSTDKNDMRERLQVLNNKTAVPLSFVIYATLETDNDPKAIEFGIHSILDDYLPDARAKEIKDGKQRKREFFRITPEEAFKQLERAAKMASNSKMPEKWKLSPIEQEEDDIGKHRKKMSFEKLGIPLNAELIFIKDRTKKCIVQKNNKVLYDGKITSLSALAKELIQSDYPLQGTAFWEYEGETLWNRRLRIEESTN